MIRWRRLVRDYEKRLDVSEAMIELAIGALLLRRIAHPRILKQALSGSRIGWLHCSTQRAPHAYDPIVQVSG